MMEEIDRKEEEQAETMESIFHTGTDGQRRNKTAKPTRQNKAVLVAVCTLLFFIGSTMGSLFTVYWLSYKPSFLPVPPVIKNIESNGTGSMIQVKNPNKTQSEDLVVQISETASQVVVKIENYQSSRRGLANAGYGSGFVVSSDGYIITNNHVVEDADALDVVFKNGKKFEAKLIGSDPISDIAVIQIKAKDLDYLKLANSDQISVGQTVIAIGNPLGYGSTVTTGVVSGIQREVSPPSTNTPDPYYFDPFGGIQQQTTTSAKIPMVGIIQTDAAINPGNSGGPLLNLNGEVIGVNFMIDSSGQGIGFAVSSNTVQKVKADLIEYGRVSWASLGVVITGNSEDVAYELELKTSEGIVVMEVPAGKAREAGIKKNDVILGIEGKPMQSPEEFITYIRSKNVGDKVKLSINRAGKTMELEVELQELSSN
ncbi:MAG: trypsin-like peptidase domain-containing protein [Caldisericia bacterium]|nr:trypsin-like peptidase domain-containing protein [Caldisericia bacterium]